MNYKRLFDPKGENDPEAINNEDLRSDEERKNWNAGDRRDGKLYLYDDETILAVNVALATGRPLLVTGPPGCGKSSLAFHVARVLERRYYDVVITSRTQAQDLTWRFDSVRRLADAQADKFKTLGEKDYVETIYPYIEPRELWWVFNRESAARRGRENVASEKLARDPAKWDPYLEQEKNGEKVGSTRDKGAVILIDEIDKADPDVPNSLLVTLGSMEFTIDVIDKPVKFVGKIDSIDERPLVIITTNQERPLPRPFLRRCVVLKLDRPTYNHLEEIAKVNFGDGEQDIKLYKQVYKMLTGEQEMVGSSHTQEKGISTAEFIDTVSAFRELTKGDSSSSKELLKQIVDKTGAIWKKVERGY